MAKTGYKRRGDVYIERRIAAAMRVRGGEDFDQELTPEEIARKALGLSAAEVKQIRESIKECEPCQVVEPHGA